VDSQFNEYETQSKFQIEELVTNLKKAEFMHQEYLASCEQKNLEIEQLNSNLQAVVKENQDLQGEKVRLMGVNQMLQ